MSHKAIPRMSLYVLLALCSMLFLGCENAQDANIPDSSAEDNLRIPDGFEAAKGPKPESYSNTGWAQEIVHKETGIELVFIPAGDFYMGSPEDEEFAMPDERPLHPVRIDKPFYMGKYEVTQGQWNMIMGTTIAEQRDKTDRPFPLRGEGDDFPMYYISWQECIEFTDRVGHGLRLPTEAEWEYACRAGTTTSFFFGDNITTKQVNHRARPRLLCLLTPKPRPKPVGSSMPNAWGLYDMHGSVWEWCQSLRRGYPYSEHDGREDLDAEGSRVTRGGSWSDYLWYCRSASRYSRRPTFRDSTLGFRVVLEIDE